MIVVKEEHEKYFEIYSNRNKKIYETKVGIFWNNSEEEPISVSKQRYDNGDYLESEIDCDIEEKQENLA